jgi:hypothetical protein
MIQMFAVWLYADDLIVFESRAWPKSSQVLCAYKGHSEAGGIFLLETPHRPVDAGVWVTSLK